MENNNEEDNRTKSL